MSTSWSAAQGAASATRAGSTRSMRGSRSPRPEATQICSRPGTRTFPRSSTSRPARGGESGLAARARPGRPLRPRPLTAPGEGGRGQRSYVDGRWDEAMTIAEQLIAAAEAGERHYSDSSIYALRAWIRLARRDTAAADLDSKRAVELARASDAQAQAAAYTIGAAVAHAVGRTDEANRLASELASNGTRGGRRAVRAVSDPHRHSLGLQRPWPWSRVRGSRARPVSDRQPGGDGGACDRRGRPHRAGDIIDSIGNRAAAAHARLRAADALEAADRPVEAAAQRKRAQRSSGMWPTR